MSDRLHNPTLALSVSELNRQVKSLLERSFLTIQVVGEISNFVRPSSGHWYFTLKDERAQVRCAMFRQNNLAAGFIPKQGERVQVSARVSLYEGRGDYQLICDRIAPDGSGALQRAFEELKIRLEQEGLFERSHKQPIPVTPSHIGVITSPTGAAIHDILTVLKRRFPGLPVTVYPTAVQGEDAAPQICRALQLAQRHDVCDVLILGRGGGSLEDLWPFNDERVARAVFACRLPVVSAVGHEVDVVISDLVADLRAPTPSAAAELLSPDQQQLRLRLSQLEQRMLRAIQRKQERSRQQLYNLQSRLRHPGQTLREQSQRLDILELRLRSAILQSLQGWKNRIERLQARLNYNSPALTLQRHQAKLQDLEARLAYQVRAGCKQKQLQLTACAARLQTVSPLATLERGYAIVSDQQGRVLLDAAQIQPGEPVAARLRHGTLRCTVTDIECD